MNPSNAKRTKKTRRFDKYGDPIAEPNVTLSTTPGNNPATAASTGVVNTTSDPGPSSAIGAYRPRLGAALLGPDGKAKKLGHFEKLIVNFTSGGSEEGLEELKKAVYEAATEVIERGSPLSRKQYDNAKRTFEVCVNIFEGRAVEDAWKKDLVAKYAPHYIDFRVKVSKGLKSEMVAAVTVCGWFSSFVVCIAKNTYDPSTGQKCGGVLLYREGLRNKLEDSTHSVIKKYNLVRHSATKGKTFGLPEVQLIIEFALLTSLFRGRLVRLQEICSMIFGLACGVRPSGLAAAHPEYVKEGKYLKTGDVKIYKRGSEVANWDLTINLLNHKGYNSTALGRTTTIFLRALTKPHNALFDTWWIVIYLWARGCIAKYKTIHELLTTEDDELVITSPDEPFFLTSVPGGTKLVPGEPLSTKRLGDNIKTLAAAVGLPNLTFYDFRRDLANDFSNKIGAQQASLLLGHQDAGSVLTEHYSHAAGNLDVLGIRTGEAEDQFLPGTASRLELRRRLGSAVCMISKALASAAQLKTAQGDNGSDYAESSGDEEVGGTTRKEDEEVQALKLENSRCWTNWLNVMDVGSPLHKAASRYSQKQQNIGKIYALERFTEATEKDLDMEGRVKNAEVALRESFNELNKRVKQVRRIAARATAAKLQANQKNDPAATFRHKDTAVEYSKKTSSLIAKISQSNANAMLEAPSTSNTPQAPTENVPALGVSDDLQEAVARMNQEEIDTPIEEAVESHIELLNYKQNNLAGKRSADAGPSVREILNNTSEILNQTDKGLELLNDQVFQDGEASTWTDSDEPDTIKDVSMGDVRMALIRLTLEPILFERECEERIKKNNGKIMCHLCQQLNPHAEPHLYVNQGRLNRHMRQQHTEWNDLVLKMTHGDGYMCPGACGPAKQFDSVEETREHCISVNCKDQAGFIEMKTNHDQVKKHWHEQDQQHQNVEVGHIRKRDRVRASYLHYLGSLTEDDMLTLADKFEVPREEVAPYVQRMLRECHFVSKSLLGA